MYDVIIIGAGFSGLQAAYSAQQAGLSTLVLEARDRVGGKVWSVPLASGRGCVELGAAWINDTLQPRVWAYAQRFGMKVVQQRLAGQAVMEPSGEERFLFPFGVTPEFSEEEKKSLEHVRDHIQAESLKPGPVSAEDDRITLEEYVRNLGALPKVIQMVNLWAQVMHGVEASEESAGWFIDYCRRNRGLLVVRADDASGGQYLRFQDGAQTIATRLAALIGHQNIHLATPVHAIHDHSAHVTVTTSTTKSYTARKLILSLPSTMYKELTITPPLPPAVRAVTDATVLGDYNKAIICYDTPWWRAQHFNGYFASYAGPVILARDTSVDAKRHFSLTCFVNGAPGRAWSRLLPHERRAAVLKQLARVFGQDESSEVWRPIEMFDQIWQHERYSRGALAPITALGHLTQYEEVYGRAVGNVHFVGTEYSAVWKGYMEGALWSGEKGAEEVVRALGGRGRAVL
ncbi:flavin-containing amine oxidase [Aspergillus japonicus CBS 114.51]|uniref:Amine oxidase n=1 Tax=Aspergillus japonicus CBS 114.51 TaxID=1448312 RepID=A0A8T8WVQ7_ASPJA|nr:flavin-containing amine oxidase [Aspergillus japonicus CBS 114.51]RAH79744.1 flavin-containing amine oxidase [Aspergillus japonicus CBS 114.51]